MRVNDMCAMGGCGDAAQSVLAAQQSALSAKIEITVAAKSLDASKQQGQAMVELIQSAAQIGKSLTGGSLFDGQG